MDGIPVVGKPHRYVIDLMHGAARNGQVNLVIRRRVQPPGEDETLWLQLLRKEQFLFFWMGSGSFLTV